MTLFRWRKKLLPRHRGIGITGLEQQIGRLRQVVVDLRLVTSELEQLLHEQSTPKGR
jgi:hypothetical protein